MKLKNLSIVFLLNTIFLIGVDAQPRPVSPRDSVKVLFDGNKIAIDYGKPSMKGRKIFGDFVHYDRIWRTGDGIATTLASEVDLELDGAVIPKGMYTIYTLPSKKYWKLIINKQTGQWGTIRYYNPQLDLARVDMKVTKLKTPIENLTYKLEKNDNRGGLLVIEWEKTSLSISFNISIDGVIPSPRDSVSLVLKGKQVSINYGRPSVRGRKIMGGVVPYNIVWRTGANAATSFVTESDLIAGEIVIPKGAYTLYTLPSSKEWKLIVNKQTGQWGTVYNKKLDFARIPLKKKILKQPVERLTIKLEQIKGNSGMLTLTWEKTELSIEFRLK